jgi:hypothetical protein
MTKHWNRNLSNADILNRLLYLQNAIECGIHSNIPACCIKFFITEKMWMQNRKCKNYYNKMKDVAVKFGFKWWGYIPCNTCLNSANVVKLRQCPSFCGKRSLFLEREIDAATTGFNLIRTGASPVSGSLSVSVARNLNRIKSLVEA